jgi:hypothetical protein
VKEYVFIFENGEIFENMYFRKYNGTSI